MKIVFSIFHFPLSVFRTPAGAVRLLRIAVPPISVRKAHLAEEISSP